MVRRRQRERSLFEVLLPDGHKLWPDWLRKIDTLLEDEAVIEVVAKGLEQIGEHLFEAGDGQSGHGPKDRWVFGEVFETQDHRRLQLQDSTTAAGIGKKSLIVKELYWASVKS
jgi:hypothetical protein